MYEKIAIIGLSGRFSEADNINQFYKNLKDGKDSVRSISENRINSTTIDPDKNYQILAYIDEIDQFDHKFFDLSFREAKNMDPRQRQLMEVTYHAIENAGISTEQIAETKTAVFVADTNLDYHKFATAFDPALDMGVTSSMLAGRISRFFRLKGKSALIDTACSSSLIALESACAELTSGKADYAIVAASDLSVFPLEKGYEYDVDILSPDGKCKPFSNNANGIGTGEAVISMVICRLKDALENGFPIHAIVNGIAVNQDAEMVNGLTAPSRSAQTSLLIEAWKLAGVKPEEIGFIETHGTGTKLGDPIEFQAISDAYREFTSVKHFCPIASVKSNIGHTDSAAGLAGVVKSILQLKHRELFPSLHFDQPNEYIDFENAPIYVNTELKPWDLKPGQSRRIAGISSFGLMGTNCHVLLEEPPPQIAVSNDNEKTYLFSISGKTPEALERNIDRLEAFVKNNPDTNPADMAFTLFQNRSSFKYRFTIEAHSKILAGVLKTRKGDYSEITSGTKVFFSFPAFYIDKFDTSLPELRKHPDFEYFFNLISKLWTENEYVQAFLFQYTYYRFLEKQGIKTNFLIGDGIGKIVIAVLQKKVSFDIAFEKIKNYTPEGENEQIEDRLQKLLEKEKVNGNVIFVEMGPLGNLGTAFKKVAGNNSVVSLKAVTKTGIYLDVFKQFYLNSLVPDILLWKFCFSGKRIDLPAYSFEKKRCWLLDSAAVIDTKQKESNPINTNLLYKLNWIKDENNLGSVVPNGAFLILGDGQGLADELLKSEHAKKFEWKKITNFNFNEVKKFINKEFVKTPLTGIIDLTYYDDYSPLEKKNDISDIHNCLNEYFSLASVMAEKMKTSGLYWMVVSWKGFSVVENEIVQPKMIMYDAFLRGLSSDFVQLQYHMIDTDSTEIVETAGVINSELGSDKLIRRCAYRSGSRFIQSVSANVELESTELEFINGYYIITGGSTGIGLELMKNIATKINKGKFIVIGRTPLPERQSWNNYKGIDSEVGDRIKAMLSIVNESIDVSYLSVDISDEPALIAGLTAELTGVSFISGIIHAAGIDGDNMPLENKTQAAIQQTFKAKINGTVNLHKLTRDIPVGFIVYTSSLNALLPQKKSFDYAAANAFMDAFAQILRKKGHQVKSIGWPGWNNIGMSKGGEIDNETSLFVDEGVDAFFRACRFGNENVLVIKGNLAKWGKNPFFLLKNDENANHTDISVFKNKVEDQAIKENLTKIQKNILVLFYEVLEENYIGINDDFFELGGHSLIGSRLTNRIKNNYDITIEFELLFDYSTVKTLSAYIEEVLVIRKLKVDSTESDEEITIL
jgi:3-oxoacyl-(acyl-carrier-protein) synthase/NAD(P)-dependent dehydrogenase (short-subunit alcohol dehydrogenase family)/acyl carrier protein